METKIPPLLLSCLRDLDENTFQCSVFQIDICETSYENFLALLEYLYTDHAPIEEGDAVGKKRVQSSSHAYTHSRARQRDS